VLNGIGTTELVLIALVLLFLFGGRKLPELSKGVGDSIREFRKAAKE
jgi:sec-independent protein translocase protein TatA